MNKQCRYCKEVMDKKATVCPHCRRKQRKISPILLIILITLIFVIGVNSLKYDKVYELSVTNTKGSVDAYGKLIWEGDIINNSEYTKENITINVICYNEAREKVGSATTTIKYINSGETLHFTATGFGQYNPNLNCEYEIK